jgi:hypothetical protein
MRNEIVNRKLTGNIRISKRRFGGFNILVEITGNTVCQFDFSYSPKFVNWVKPTENDLRELKLF